MRTLPELVPAIDKNQAWLGVGCEPSGFFEVAIVVADDARQSVTGRDATVVEDEISSYDMVAEL